jgi:excinuclease ABC subunit B
MKQAIDETDRRRKLQTAYNEAHGITPETVRRAVLDISPGSGNRDFVAVPIKGGTGESVEERVEELRAEMLAAAEALDFERAAELRDRLRALSGELPEQVKAPPKKKAGGGMRGRRR